MAGIPPSEDLEAMCAISKYDVKLDDSTFTISTKNEDDEGYSDIEFKPFDLRYIRNNRAYDTSIVVSKFNLDIASETTNETDVANLDKPFTKLHDVVDSMHARRQLTIDNRVNIMLQQRFTNVDD